MNMVNSTEYIKAFNEKFKNTISAFKHPNRVKLDDEIKKYIDCYTAVDSLGFKYGLEIFCQHLESEKEYVYLPILRKKKLVHGSYETSELPLSSPVRDIKVCYEILAKEWIYHILLNRNFIEGKSIYDLT